VGFFDAFELDFVDVGEVKLRVPDALAAAPREFLWQDAERCHATSNLWFPRRLGGNEWSINGGESIVSNPDEVKGRIKEAAGDLTGDDDLTREGKVERAEGTAKRKVDDAAEKVKDAVTTDD
jgi:uncharacterized protein YjbJ (UPF0337 family)